MIKRQYSGNERRARNYIWNAAGRYDFEPSFLAFSPDGSPDMYYNLVIGLAYKWLDMEVIQECIKGYSASRSAEEFDDLFWLGLENCVYEKEIGERPVLEKLRREKAEAWFKSAADMSRQQMEMQSMTVYEQQMIRWSKVLGRFCHAGGRSLALAGRLLFSGSLDAEGAVGEMTGILRDFFRTDISWLKEGGERKGILFALSLPGFPWKAPRQRLFLRTGDGRGDLDTNVRLGHTMNRRVRLPSGPDMDFVRAAFGEPSLPEREMTALEEDCCRDLHAACRLHVTDGVRKEQGREAFGELSGILKRAADQEKVNRRFVSDNALLIHESIRELSARLDLLFAEYFRRMPERGRSGSLIPEKAYRLKVFRDPSVFYREGTLTERNVEVTLLLDASMSRMNVQEIIASEAYIMAESLEKIHIPVRVLTFRTIRGITVLERLRNTKEKSSGRIFRFFSGGWNRDGLAFRALGSLLEAERGEKEQLLIVLTDACPNDDMPALMDPSGRALKEYEGVTAVSDTEKAVHDLRKAGIRTAAVFFGSVSHLENVQQIYGKEYVRIRKLNRIADAAQDLIRMTLQEMTLQI